MNLAIDWKEVRSEYEEGDLRVDAIARRYGLKADTIKKRAQSESWKKSAKKARRRPVKVMGPADISCEHRRLWKGVKKRLVSGLKSADLKTGLEELKVAKVAGEVLASVIKGEREAWGLNGGIDGDARVDAGEIAAEMAALTVSQRTDEAVE